MKIIDLTQLIKEDMPVFPGTEGPIIEQTNTLERDGFVEHRISMYSHTGTHMDAPSHMLAGGLTLDKYSIDKFIGKAVKIDFEDRPKELIQVSDLEKYEELLNSADFLIIYTGWCKFWGTPRYFEDFPALSIEAVDWLKSFNLKGVGIDAISVDAMEDVTFPIHNALMAREAVIIENLRNLEELPREFIFSCLPLKVINSDGSPIRAIAIL